ncbi:MAG: type I methionyl aminopeptidase [Mariniblastus sp.]|nr:type I methionyl aminopeptidase [Mariniblastus sp.]
MRAAGLVVWQAHQAAARILKPGVSTEQLNQAYRDTFTRCDATPLFLNYGGPPGFPAETCISINDEIVHGIPGSRLVEEGDLVSLDTGCRLNGWCGDAAVTHAVGSISVSHQKLLDVTLGALNLAIELMATCSRWSQVAKEMEHLVKSAGFFVVEEMVGHGIGQNLHEPPQVPNYLSEALQGSEDFDLRPGVVLAIEPMVNLGTNAVVCLDDDWTLVTDDGKASAHFEHTIAITGEGPLRLTGPPSEEELRELPDWLQDREQWVIW